MQREKRSRAKISIKQTVLYKVNTDQDQVVDQRNPDIDARDKRKNVSVEKQQNHTMFSLSDLK